MYFEQAIQVRYMREGFPDDGLAPGPTIVSTASLQTVCEWFPGMALDEARRRFRTTLEIAGASASADEGAFCVALDTLPPFWEDQLFADIEIAVVRFKIGEVAFEGSNPCARCPVPARESQTGVTDDGFQKRFTDLRRAQLPAVGARRTLRSLLPPSDQHPRP